MDNKLTEKQEDKIHGGMILLGQNNTVYVVDETNYNILSQCTFEELSSSDIPLTNISELSLLDHVFNDSYYQNLRGNKTLPNFGRLQSGIYRKIVKGQDGSPKILDGFINVP